MTEEQRLKLLKLAEEAAKEFPEYQAGAVNDLIDALYPFTIVVELLKKT